jgi:general L-amino acid transport system substrate-binding protein
LIDTETAEQFNIGNLEDFRDPEIAAMFDYDSDGKADLIGCEEDWGCADVIDHHLEAYQLQDTVEHVQGEYNTLMREVIARVDNSEPVLFYTWTPNWTIGRLSPGPDVVWLEVPFASLPTVNGSDVEQEDPNITTSVLGCVEERDPCAIGYPPNDIRVVASTVLLENLVTRRLLELVEIPLADIANQNSLMLNGQDTPADIARHATNWINANQAQIDEWVDEARQLEDTLPAIDSTLARVHERGTLRCGVHGELRGFSYREDDGSYSGFDADFCRVIATAVLSDAEAVEFVPVDLNERFQFLSDREIDVLFRNTTWTSLRDVGMDSPNSGIRLDFGPTTFHDGQRFMVRTSSDINSLEDLDGKVICVQENTTSFLNLRDQFAAREINYTPAAQEDSEDVYSFYNEGICDAVTSDTSQLVAKRLELDEPDKHKILSEPISREPLGPVYLENDSHWGDIINWSVYATIYAEEEGVFSDNIEERLASGDPDVARLLGEQGDIGERLGLDRQFARRIIEDVGNYAEIYEQHLGAGTATQPGLELDRGPNKAWNNGEGGVLSSPPFR